MKVGYQSRIGNGSESDYELGIDYDRFINSNLSAFASYEWSNGVNDNRARARTGHDRFCTAFHPPGLQLFAIAFQIIQATNHIAPRLGRNNAQGEYYLTDIVAMAVAEGVAVSAAQPAAQHWQAIKALLHATPQKQKWQGRRTLVMTWGSSTAVDEKEEGCN